MNDFFIKLFLALLRRIIESVLLPEVKEDGVFVIILFSLVKLFHRLWNGSLHRILQQFLHIRKEGFLVLIGYGRHHWEANSIVPRNYLSRPPKCP